MFTRRYNTKIDMANCPSIRLIMGSTLIVLFLVLLMDSRAARKEGFQGVLDMPKGDAILNPQITASEANDGFRKVLAYMEKNPKNTSEFMNFLKSSFFTSSAQFNPSVNFSAAVENWKGGTFRDKSTDV